MRGIITYIMTMLVGASTALADIAGLDGLNYYANGKAESASKPTAEADACASAKRELISFVFGLSTKINSNVVQTLDQTQLTQTINVNSDWLNLKGLKQDFTTSPQASGKFLSECRVLYSKAEADREKVRIAKARSVLEREKLNRATFENADPTRFGRLTIRSNVSKAKVFLDSVFWGHTPLEIDRVPVGQHTLSISADAYSTESQAVTIAIGDAKEVFVALAKNLVRLELKGLPAKAVVWVNGMQVNGKMPALEPGETIIRAEAPYYRPYQDVLILRAGANVVHEVKMTPKPVPVAFASKGEPATVYVNGERIGDTPTAKDLVAGKYVADFMTSRGIIHSQNFTINPSESYSVIAPKQSKISTSSARFASVVLYKDASLAIRKDYQSFVKIPAQSEDTKTIGFSIELMEPKEGFIYVNDKLAGKRAIVVDDVMSSNVTIRFEAPGYYPGSITLSPFVRQSGESDPPELVRMQYRGQNDYKVFLFRQKPAYEVVTLGIDRSSTIGKKIRGAFDAIVRQSEFGFIELANLPRRAEPIPPLVIEVQDAGNVPELGGAVTDLLLSDPSTFVCANSLLTRPGGSITGCTRNPSGGPNAHDGYLSGRTIFVGHSAHFPAIRGQRGSKQACYMGMHCYYTDGPPFGVANIKVKAVNPELENAKRYSH